MSEKSGKPEWRAALDDFVAAVTREYGGRLKGVILYGSRARGEAAGDSDVDVLVVLGEVEDHWAERHRLGDIAYRVTAESDRWDDRAGWPLYRNVHREGKVLV